MLNSAGESKVDTQDAIPNVSSVKISSIVWPIKCTILT